MTMQHCVEFENGAEVHVYNLLNDEMTLGIGNGYDSGFCEVTWNDIDNLIEFLRNLKAEYCDEVV